MNLRIKKDTQYRESSSGDSSGDTEKEDHTESTMYVRKGAVINKQDGESTASDDENSSDRREQARTNMRSTPFGKGAPHTTTKRNASSTTSTSGRKLALAQQVDTSRVGSIQARRHRRKCPPVQRVTMIILPKTSWALKPRTRTREGCRGHRRVWNRSELGG